jgi:bile acid:Na+ symporter, BASS family
MEPQQLILLAFQVSIVLTVFGFGLQATSDDLLYLVRRPGLLGRSLLAMFLVMPVIAVTLALMFNLRRAVEIDVVALAISAVPPLLPGRGSRAGGHTSYALGLMVIVAVLSIVIVPAAVTLIGWLVGRSLALAPGVVAQVVLTAIVVPVMAGMAFRAYLPAVANHLEKPLTIVALVILPAAVIALLVGTASAIWAIADSGTLLAMTVFVVAGLAIGHVLGGPEPDHAVVLALSTACRHPGIAIGIVAANFPDVRPGATILLYLLVAAVLCIPYIAWHRRHVAGAVPA